MFIYFSIHFSQRFLSLLIELANYRCEILISPLLLEISSDEVYRLANDRNSNCLHTTSLIHSNSFFTPIATSSLLGTIFYHSHLSLMTIYQLAPYLFSKIQIFIDPSSLILIASCSKFYSYIIFYQYYIFYLQSHINIHSKYFQHLRSVF